MSTQPAERHVRVCPTHLVEVAERGTSLICPRGQHAVSHFKVIDRLKRTAVEVAVDGDERRGGIVTDLPRKPVAVAPPAAPQKDKRTETVAIASFEDDDGARLYVKLMRKVLARRQSFVVRWARHEPGARNAAKTGTLADETYLEKAREAYNTALATARKDGWRDRAVLSHRVRFLPLPKPATTKKGR